MAEQLLDVFKARPHWPAKEIIDCIRVGFRVVLMVAIGRDGNEQMFPIAWAAVEGENTLSWEWFFKELQHSLSLEKGEGVVFVSDEHQAILSGIASVFPSAEHRHCARHIFANWHKAHKGDEMKLVFWKIAQSYNLADMNDAYDELRLMKLLPYLLRDITPNVL
ncbi:Transposase for insertion sequence element ISRM5 [Bienertia sinuspersici]